MAGRLPVPSTALLRSLNGQFVPRCPRHQPGLQVRILPIILKRAFHLSPGYHRDVDDSDGMTKSFRAQLFESTAARMQKQRDADAAHGRNQPLSMFARNCFLAFAIIISSGLAYVAGSHRPYILHPDSTLTLQDAALIPGARGATKLNLQNAWVDLCLIVGDANVSEDHADREAHNGANLGSYQAKKSDKPAIIVRPATTKEISKILAMCHTRRIPVTTFAGGSSTEGQVNATRGGICIDISRLNAVIDVHLDDGDIVVQPGVRWAQLKKILAEHNQRIPLITDDMAMLGGILGNGVSGSMAHHFGRLEDWILNLTVVLPDGTIIKTAQRARQSVPGYNLNSLFAGSEGTLGIITEATLKTCPLPTNEGIIVSTFPDLQHAAECASTIVRNDPRPTMLDILDPTYIKWMKDRGIMDDTWKESPTMVLKHECDSKSAKDLQDIVRRCVSLAGGRSVDQANHNDGVRFSALNQGMIAGSSALADRQDDPSRIWMTDASVPLSRYSDLLGSTSKDIEENGLSASLSGHVGTGTLKVTFKYDQQQRPKVEAAVKRLADRALSMSGTSIGERGVGISNRDALVQEVGQTTVDAMRKLKRSFDPICLLNCDKVMRADIPAQAR